MNEKFAIEVLVPALGKTIEFIVPSVMETNTAKGLIIEMLSEQYENMTENEEDLWLIDMESKKKIPSKSTCKQAGIKDGSKLMLVWIN